MKQSVFNICFIKNDVVSGVYQLFVPFSIERTNWVVWMSSCDTVTSCQVVCLQICQRFLFSFT